MRLASAESSRAKTLAAGTGATAIFSLEEMAQTSSSIITMLPNTPNVEAVYLGNIDVPREGGRVDPSQTATAAAAVERGVEARRGLLDLVPPGTLLVDSSTIDPLASRRINAIAKSKVSSGDFIDYPYNRGGGGGFGYGVDGNLSLDTKECCSVEIRV